MAQDYYDILGTTKSASQDEIKKAYRKKAMEWHPDKHKGDKKAEEKFKQINNAYQTLSDPQKRKQYDTFGSAGAGGQGFGGFPGDGGGSTGGFSGFDFGDIFGAGGGQRQQNVEFDLGDIFSSFGGSGGNRSAYSQPVQDLDMTRKIDIDLKDLLLGTKISVEGPDRKRFKFTIPENTKPGTKFKIKDKGRSSGGQRGNLYIIANAKMPKKLTDKMKEEIKKW